MMAVVRYRPTSDLFNIRDEMNRLFNVFFGHVPATGDSSATYGPDMDVGETDSEFHVSVEVPGMEQNDIKVTVRDDVLTLKGEKKRENEVENAVYHLNERSYGAFERSVTLPAHIRPDRVTATYTNGILNVTLPKAEEAKPKEIAVKVAE